MDTTMTSLPILKVGLNHKVAPVEVRERLAFRLERITVIMEELKRDETAEVNEIVLLSSCSSHLPSSNRRKFHV